MEELLYLRKVINSVLSRSIEVTFPSFTVSDKLCVIAFEHRI
jgi:hypothetical protein